MVIMVPHLVKISTILWILISFRQTLSFWNYKSIVIPLSFEDRYSVQPYALRSKTAISVDGGTVNAAQIEIEEVQ